MPELTAYLASTGTCHSIDANHNFPTVQIPFQPTAEEDAGDEGSTYTGKRMVTASIRFETYVSLHNQGKSYCETNLRGPHNKTTGKNLSDEIGNDVAGTMRKHSQSTKPFQPATTDLMTEIDYAFQ